MKPNASSVAPRITLRILGVLLIIMSGSLFLPASSSIAASRHKSQAARSVLPKPITSTSVGTQCTLPGVQVLSDPANDQVGNQAGANQQLDLLGVYVAELGCEPNTLRFTIKVQNMNSTPMPNAQWEVYMNVNDTHGNPRRILFEMDTTDNPTGAVNFNYGYTDPTAGDITQCSAGCPVNVSGSFASDGTITIQVHTGAILSFGDLSGAHIFDVDLNPIGTSLTNILGQTQLLVGVLGNGQSETIDDTTNGSGPAAYITSGNAFCPADNECSFPVPPPAPQDPGPKIGYENFQAPGLLTQVTSTGSGGLTVEYMGRNAGEPSVGSNWKTGVANFQSDLETLFVTFDDSCSLTNPKATWVNRRAPTSQVVDSDPIGFTDRQTGRVFAAELTLLSPDTVKISHSDDDGVTWTPDQSGGIGSAVDHETIGGGPYHAPVPTGISPVYPNAVYYCSQDLGPAFCARSDDGGLTYGPSVLIYNIGTCTGLHGHVKVSPKDGTVYVPNRDCGGQSAVVASQDNGVTWTVRPVKSGPITSTAASDDPAVGIDGNGRVYFLFSDNGTIAGVATSDDSGQTWQNMFDVGAIYGLKQVAFPAAVGGDPGRAAVAFYGSTTPGSNSGANDFTGVWHLYVAHTFDGGLHWTTTDATPALPMQRSGLLRGPAGPMTRNLLDFFDITIDRDGRVLVGYVNGCEGGNCAQAPIAADGSSAVTGNAYTATATIARQSSGRRMLAAHDPASPTSAPGMPFVTQRRIGNIVRLAWSEADSGNSMINNYQILRSTSAGNETLLATISGTQTGGTYDDVTATDNSKTYYYKVIAVNSVGPSCANNEIAAPFVGDTCSGVIIHKNDPSHPESTGGGTGMAQPPAPQLLIDYVAVGEPPGTNQLMFKMKVGNLTTLPPNSQWRVVWNSFASPSEQFYVGMTTDQNGVASFEYGTEVTTVVVAVGIGSDNKLGAADPGSSYNPDGTITIYVPKSAVGSPRPGDLLGAVNGRTYVAPVAQGRRLIDHTFAKGNTDNGYPPATYTITGNSICSSGNIEPISAVSRKTHGSAGDFDIDLPLTGQPGIEDRTGGASGSYKVIVTFAVPVSVTNATVTPGNGGSGSVSNFSVNNTQVTVNLTNVTDAQTLTINLLGVSGGGNSGNVAVPMSVLVGDTNADRFCDAVDVSQTKSQSGNAVGLSNFREDVNVDGFIDAVDTALVKSKSGTALP